MKFSIRPDRTKSMHSRDVVIVGGGVIGSSVAYWLAADPDFDGSIVVIERDPTNRFRPT